jgi:hypothetical protein
VVIIFRLQLADKTGIHGGGALREHEEMVDQSRNEAIISDFLAALLSRTMVDDKKDSRDVKPDAKSCACR